MLSTFRSIAGKVYLYLLRKRQFDSLKLRQIFRDKHRIDVGLYSYGCFDQWRMPGPIRIGRYCSFANTVRSAPINHLMNAITTHPALYERAFGVVDKDIEWNEVLVIEDDVWVGHNVMILPGCKYIGRGAVIGAGAVVTKNVPAYAVMAGNPARKLRDRFDPELMCALEASRWWELDTAALRDLVSSNHELVYSPDVASIDAWTRTRGS